MLEEGTLLYQKVKNQDVSIVSEEEVAKEYAYVQTFLEKLGLKQYEISNFAKKGYECRHNQNYWERGEYLAFGASAHGFNQNVRWENASDVQKYIALPVSKLAVATEKLGQTDKIVETIMLALRTTKGLNLEHIKNLGFDVLKEKGGEIRDLKNAGLIEIKNGFLRITPKNFVVSNSIILKLIP
jgi:oxygen-independent coproporphyrinogen-3 oxidase